jgi:hypothetical protein
MIGESKMILKFIFCRLNFIQKLVSDIFISKSNNHNLDCRNGVFNNNKLYEVRLPYINPQLKGLGFFF